MISVRRSKGNPCGRRIAVDRRRLLCPYRHAPTDTLTRPKLSKRTRKGAATCPVFLRPLAQRPARAGLPFRTHPTDPTMTHLRVSARPSTRTTLALTATHSTPQASLSYEADLALRYAGLWLRAAGSPKVPASGVIRRALEVYVRHLEAAHGPSEVRAVKSACVPLPPRPETQQMAELRLYACQPGEPLPPFSVVLRGPNAAREMAELTARAEAIAEQCIASRPFHRKPKEPST